MNIWVQIHQLSDIQRAEVPVIGSDVYITIELYSCTEIRSNRLRIQYHYQASGEYTMNLVNFVVFGLLDGCDGHVN